MLVQMAFRRTEILTDSGISFHVFALPCTQYFLVSLLLNCIFAIAAIICSVIKHCHEARQVVSD